MGSARASLGSIPVASRDGWRWSPRNGRWRPDFGLPEVPVVVEASSSMAPGNDRWDFWRDIVFYEFDADPLAPELSRRFSASGMAALTQRALLHHWRSDAMSGQRTRAQAEADGGDALCVGIVLAGERLAEDAEGRRWRNGPGEAFVYDGGQASRIWWTQHEGLHLTLRRPVVTALLGEQLPGAAELSQRINRSRLFHLVREQLVAAARSLPKLAEPEQAFALDQAQRLVSFLLSRSVEGQENSTSRANLHAAAMRLIETNLAAPELDPEWLAGKLGCSRTTLYRAFADRGDTVAAAIQRTRFDRARIDLLATRHEIPVAEVAARCGLYDAANFSSQFKRRFGYAPGDLRRGSAHP